MYYRVSFNFLSSTGEKTAPHTRCLPQSYLPSLPLFHNKTLGFMLMQWLTLMSTSITWMCQAQRLLGPTLEFHIHGSGEEADFLRFPRFLTDNASSPSPGHLTPAAGRSHLQWGWDHPEVIVSAML